MQTCVFTPTHETGILMADIIPYAGSPDTRLGRESSWLLAPSGTHSFFRPLRVKGFFCARTGRAAFLLRRNGDAFAGTERHENGDLPCATLSPCLSGRMGPQGLVLRSCRIGATSSWRNWTRIPLGTENCRSLLSGSHARKGVSVETGILPALPQMEVHHGRALYALCRLGCP